MSDKIDDMTRRLLKEIADSKGEAWNCNYCGRPYPVGHPHDCMDEIRLMRLDDEAQDF